MAVFENHSQLLKATHKLNGNRVNLDNGILYLGDGAWGVNQDNINYINKCSINRDKDIF